MTERRTLQAVRSAAAREADAFDALMIDAEALARETTLGLHGRRRAGLGETYWQHRPYAFGDAVSAIDWRQSARSADRLYVRETEWETAASLNFWRDPSHSLDYASNPALPQKGRRADILAIALAVMATRAGERVASLGQERRAFHGRNAPSRLLETFLGERAREEARSSSPPAPSLAAGSAVIYISDFFGNLEEVADCAARHSARGLKGALVQVIDPAERIFPFEGRTRFVDPEGPSSRLFGDAGAVADDYRAAFADHESRLSAIARAAGWRFIRTQTDEPARGALASLYDHLAPQGALG